MIPLMNIIAWGNVAPWGEQRQIEQDLIIGRALVELFSDRSLQQQLRFRGGTALNKLHFPAPLRYSEDIDLVRTEEGPIGDLFDQIRNVLDPWLGRGRSDISKVSPKLRYVVPAEGGGEIRLKVEINTRERRAYDPVISIPFQIDNPWFSGRALIPTFSREEMLATKLRALLQRSKGRDLFDMSHALEVFEGLNPERVVQCCLLYFEHGDLTISRAEAEHRMFSKLGNPDFAADMRPLVTPTNAERLTDGEVKRAFCEVFSTFITALPGEPWQKTDEMTEYFGLSELLRE